jgi:hypothetical protein
MTRSTPNYDARDFDPVEDVKIRLPRITGRSIIEACGEILAQQKKRIDSLEAEQKREIAELRERLDQLERGSTKPKLVAPSPPGSMIA